MWRRNVFLIVVPNLDANAIQQTGWSVSISQADGTNI